MCMGKFLGVRKPITMSEIQNFKILTPFVTSWTQKWPKMVQKSPKTPEILIKWLCWSQNACRWVSLGWKTDFGVKIMTFWVFEEVRRYCDVKYDVRYHEIAKNVIQMMLECQQMIELSWKLVWVHIFTRGTRWWCQNTYILTWWRLKWYCDVK